MFFHILEKTLIDHLRWILTGSVHLHPYDVSRKVISWSCRKPVCRHMWYWVLLGLLLYWTLWGFSIYNVVERHAAIHLVQFGLIYELFWWLRIWLESLEPINLRVLTLLKVELRSHKSCLLYIFVIHVKPKAWRVHDVLVEWGHLADILILFDEWGAHLCWLILSDVVKLFLSCHHWLLRSLKIVKVCFRRWKHCFLIHQIWLFHGECGGLDLLLVN
jgi:hypothetical protein